MSILVWPNNCTFSVTSLLSNPASNNEMLWHDPILAFLHLSHRNTQSLLFCVKHWQLALFNTLDSISVCPSNSAVLIWLPISKCWDIFTADSIVLRIDKFVTFFTNICNSYTTWSSKVTSIILFWYRVTSVVHGWDCTLLTCINCFNLYQKQTSLHNSNLLAQQLDLRMIYRLLSDLKVLFRSDIELMPLKLC